MDRCGVSGMNTLKEILVDAARYRWLRERFVSVRWDDGECSVAIPMVNGANLDASIDSELSLSRGECES